MCCFMSLLTVYYLPRGKPLDAISNAIHYLPRGKPLDAISNAIYYLPRGKPLDAISNLLFHSMIMFNVIILMLVR